MEVRRWLPGEAPAFCADPCLCFSPFLPPLQEDLDKKLQQRQARETGICPVREELYAQCFGAYAS